MLFAQKSIHSITFDFLGFLNEVEKKWDVELRVFLLINNGVPNTQGRREYNHLQIK